MALVIIRFLTSALHLVANKAKTQQHLPDQFLNGFTSVLPIDGASDAVFLLTIS